MTTDSISTHGLIEKTILSFDGLDSQKRTSVHTTFTSWIGLSWVLGDLVSCFIHYIIPLLLSFFSKLTRVESN